MGWRRGVLSCACAAMLQPACSSSHSATGVADAHAEVSTASGPDAAVPHDAPDDTRTDQPLDVVDAGDAGSDASSDALPPEENPFLGEWWRLPTDPSTCHAEISLNPEQAFPAIPWKPCPSGRTGCLIYTVDWFSVKGFPSIGTPVGPSIVEFDGVPHIPIRRIYRDRTTGGRRFVVDALVPRSGPAKFVVASNFGDDACQVEPSFSQDGTVYLQYISFDETDTRAKLYAASWDAPLQVKKVDPRGLLGGRTTYSYLTDGVIVSRVERPDTGTALVGTSVEEGWVRAAPASHGGAAWLDTPRVAPDGVFGLAGPGYSGIFLINKDFTNITQIYADPPDESIIFYHLDPSSNHRNEVTWLQVESTKTHATFWTSPYARTSSEARPRSVARFDQDSVCFRCAFVVNDGYALFPEESHLVGRLVRLSDGKGWRLPTEPGVKLVHPIFVDDEYAWFLTYNSVDNDPWATTGFLLISVKDLGEPDFGNGLDAPMPQPSMTSKDKTNLPRSGK